MSADPNPTPDIVSVDPVPNPDQPSPHIPAGGEVEILAAPLTPEAAAEVKEIIAHAKGEIVTVEIPPPQVAYLSNPLADYDQETVKLICDQQTKVDELLADFESKNTEAREAKKKHEAAVEQLQELVRERAKSRGKPVQRTLFDIIPTVAPPIEGVKAGEPGTEDVLASLWREYPMDRMTRFGMTETDIQKLADGQRKGGHDPFPIKTVGQMADYTSNAHGTAGYENRIADFKGVGPGAATRIEDGLEQFWKWWNNTGCQEYATERGIISGPQAQPGDGATDPQQPGGEGGGGEPAASADGELEGASIGDVQFTEPQPEPIPAEEQFVPPEGEGDEYSLGAEEGPAAEGAVPEVPESEDAG